MADLILDESHAKCMRFSCKCGDPGHILDIWMAFNEGIVVDVSLYESLWSNETSSLKERTKAAYKFIRGGFILQHHFVLRSDDIPMMTTFLGSADVINIVNNLSKIMDNGSHEVD